MVAYNSCLTEAIMKYNSVERLTDYKGVTGTSLTQTNNVSDNQDIPYGQYTPPCFSKQLHTDAAYSTVTLFQAKRKL